MKSFLKRHWVVILVIFLAVLLFGMNYQKEETHKYIGVVINKEFIPPSSSVTIIRNTIHTETLPEEYNLLVEVTFTKTRFWKTESETKQLWFANEYFYPKLEQKDRVTIKVTVKKDILGRILEEKFILIGPFTGT